MEGGDFYIIQSQKHGEWNLVYTEHYKSLVEARTRERQVKKWKSRRMIEQLMKRKEA